MNDVVVATHLENLDRRVGHIEQILPTLATREELHAAIAPLATKAELQEVYDQLRRHMDVLHEDVRSDIRLLAEHLAVVTSRRLEE